MLAAIPVLQKRAIGQRMTGSSRCLRPYQCQNSHKVPPMVTATVREWREEEGWGVLDSPETPGGCWGHFSNIEMAGFRTLSPGQQVDLTWEAPGFKQDGYDYRAVSIVPRPA
jgi:CspA family cold shock protein